MTASSTTIRLGERRVGHGFPCYIIAEIGVNFNGDLELAKKTISAAAQSGADAVKFQTFKASEFLADENLTYTFTQNDGTELTVTQYDMFKQLELPHAWHAVLQEHARSVGVEFLSSAADPDAADLLESLSVPALKLASEDLINIRLIEHVARKGMPTILSTGMAELEEIQLAVDIFRQAGNKDLILLHCTSSYPTRPEECNLRRITSLQKQFPHYPIGFSDHTVGPDAAVIATALGACLVEKHFTLDNCLPGPDHAMSANPEQLAQLVCAIRRVETMMGSGDVTYARSEEKGRIQFRRSIVASKDILPGEVITEDKLAYKRPGHGLKPYQRELVIGRKAMRPISINQIITMEDVEG